MRRTPIRRSRPKTWLRDPDDKVTPELHAYIMRRDKQCVAALLDPAHECRTRFGRPHLPTAVSLLTLDHVHDAATMGDRAKSDIWHLVAMCGWGNNEGWASAHREEERRYLKEKEG